MPMILATSAVHSWLTRKGLRTFTSLNVRAAECLDTHYFAVLVGVGATTVNAYLAEAAPWSVIKRDRDRAAVIARTAINCGWPMLLGNCELTGFTRRCTPAVCAHAVAAKRL